MMLGASRVVLFGVSDPSARAWAAAVVAAGGSVSPPRLALVSTLIRRLKACGAWALTDDYAVYAGESATQGLVTLKARQTHVATNSPTFTVNRGFKGDGVSAFVQTTWNPTVGGPQFVRNSARFGVWVYAAPTVTSYLMGMDDFNFNEIKWDATNISYGVNGLTAFETYAHGGTVTGWHALERTGATAESAYLNGVQKGTGVLGSVAVNNVAGRVLCSTQGAGARLPTDAGASAACWGAPLTNAAMYLAEYNAFRAFMTAVGVP